MKIIKEPKIYLVGRQIIDKETVAKFLNDHEVTWATDSDVGAELLSELAGRVCYLSFGTKQGRKSNKEYLSNIIDLQHGSVLEHAVWNLVITGVSRSFSHELVRHRAGWGYSQLSQRYVDESTTDFVEPEIIVTDPELHDIWLKAVETSHKSYCDLVNKLTEKINNRYPNMDRTSRRKMARQASRSVLPNATETKIFVTANARALRHFIELRGSEYADPEIRKVAIQILKIMQVEAPNIFSDYEIYTLNDGTLGARTTHRKV